MFQNGSVLNSSILCRIVSYVSTTYSVLLANNHEFLYALLKLANQSTVRHFVKYGSSIIAQSLQMNNFVFDLRYLFRLWNAAAVFENMPIESGKKCLPGFAPHLF